jgi:hypothetical protein
MQFDNHGYSEESEGEEKKVLLGQSILKKKAVSTWNQHTMLPEE